MPQMIDIAEVEAHMVEFRANQRKLADEPGVQGAVARCQLAVLPELTIWRAKEMNRGSDPNTVMSAIVMLVAATVAGELMSLCATVEAANEVSANTLTAIHEEIGEIFARQKNLVSKRFEFTEAGTA